MAICDFTGKEIRPGTGKIYVLKNGKVLNFSSAKAQKSYLKLKRVPRKTKWSAHYEKGN